jgi:NADPH2:quinone reductase
MRCVVCPVHGTPEVLEVQERPSRLPGDGEVRVAIRAAGVNFPDSLLVAGNYQVKAVPPFIPGLEAAGVVLDVGPRVTGVVPGDSVIIDGSSALQGLYAEEATVARDLLIPCPPGLDFAQAAAYPVVYGTSYHALVDRGRLQLSETLVVLGAAGGVGLSACQIGMALGARVIAVVGDDAKAAALRDLGITEIINYGSQDLRESVLEATSGKGADVIYDPVGGDLFDASTRFIAKEGRLLIIGFASGRIASVAANRLLLKEASAIGVLYGNWKAREPQKANANLAALADLCARGVIRPHVWKRFPFSRAAEALGALTARDVVGKVVLEPDPA